MWFFNLNKNNIVDPEKAFLNEAPFFFFEEKERAPFEHPNLEIKRRKYKLEMKLRLENSICLNPYSGDKFIRELQNYNIFSQGVISKNNDMV